VSKPRLVSLDAFRGATVALMIVVNNPGSWNHLFSPLAHAPWHGCTPTDLVFPFFLFAVGNALAIVMPGLREAGAAAFWVKVLRRGALIFATGVLLNWSPFVRYDAAGELVLRGFENLRYLGVLQRIGLAYVATAAIVWWAGERGAWWAAAALLVGYWAACHAFGAPGDPYSLEAYFGTALDRALLGSAHLYKGEGVPFDPEGLASTVPAVAQVLLGYGVGAIVVRGTINSDRLVRLFVIGCALLVLAYAWQLEMPLNKKIWTSSFVLHTTGIATLALAALLWWAESRGRRGPGSSACAQFGRNALAIFVLSGLLPRLLGLIRFADGTDDQGRPRNVALLPWLYRGFFEPLPVDPRIASLLFALANLAFYWAIAAGLDRRRIYIRL
jgi:predicted acyltransferase